MFLVFSFVVYCKADSQVDIDKLFHANPPSLSPNKPANAQKQQNSADPVNSVISEVFEDDFNPYRGSRHDEFDWALIKVNFIKKVLFLYSNNPI